MIVSKNTAESLLTRDMQQQDEVVNTTNKETELKFYPAKTEELTSVTVAFPGVVPRTELAYKKQIPVLQNAGNLLLVEYSQVDFSQQEVEEKVIESILPYIERGMEVNLIGSSFGTRCAVEFIRNNPELQKHISHSVLLGACFSINDMLPFLQQQIGRVLKLVSKRKTTVGLIKNRFNYDPFIYEGRSRGEITESIDNRGLGERINFFLEPPNLEEIEIPTSLVWWEKERVSEERIKKIENMFPNSRSFGIKGDHGHLHTTSEEINEILNRVLAN